MNQGTGCDVGFCRRAAVPSRSTSARVWVSKYSYRVPYSALLRLGTATLRVRWTRKLPRWFGRSGACPVLAAGAPGSDLAYAR